jgi:hypothetical protein
MAVMAWGQTTSTQNGPWSDPATWGGNPVPDFNSGTITVNHIVTIDEADYPIGSPLQVDQLVIGATGNLTLAVNASLQILPGAGTDFTNAAGGTFVAEATSEFISNAGVAYSTTGANTTFDAGAVLRVSSTAIPTVSSYDNVSIFLEGLTGAFTMTASWNQLTALTSLIVDCPNLGNNAINFSGQITALNDLQIVNTDGNAGGRVVLNSAGTSTISIGSGGLTVQDDSRLFLTNGGNLTLNLNGEFTFSSTSTNFSQCATTGTGTINFNNGDFAMTSGLWRMAASGSGGDGFFNFNNASNLQISGGVVSENGSGTAQGTFSFTGSLGDQDLNWPVSSIGIGTINVVIDKSSGDVIQADALTISNLTLSAGSLITGGNNLTINGAIAVTSGLIDATTPINFTLGGTGSLPATLPFVPGSVLTGITLSRSGVSVVTSGVSLQNLALVTISAGALGSAIPALGVYDLLYNNTSSLTTGPEIPVNPSVLRNLTKQAAGTVNLNANVTINGDLTLSAGTFASGAFNVSLAGDFADNGAFTMSSTSTFTFLTRAPSNIHALSGSGTCTFGILDVNGALTVTKSATSLGNITIQSGSSLQATSGTWTFGGSTLLTNNGSGIAFNAISIGTGFLLTGVLSGSFSVAGNFTGNGTFNANGGTVVFNGATTLFNAIKTFNNVTVNNASSLGGATGWVVTGNVINNGTINFTSGTLTWNSDGSFSGSSPANLSTITISDGRTLNLSLAANLTLANDLNMNTGVLNHTSTNDLIIGDDLLGNGTFTSSGRLIFTGAAAAMFNTGAMTMTSLRVTGTLTVGGGTSYTFTNTGTIDVTGTLNSNTGAGISTSITGTTTVLSTGLSTTFNLLNIGNSATLNATGTIRLNNNFVNNGTFNHGNGTIVFNTTGGSTKSIISNNSVTFFNLSIQNNGNALDVANNIATGSVNLAGILSVSPSAVFDADGTANNKSFVVLSTADDPANDGSIGPLLSGAQVTGNFTVQRFVSTESVDRLYRYIASPVVGATVAQWQDDFFVTGIFTGAHNGSTPGCTGCTATSSSFFYDESIQAYVKHPLQTGSNTDPLVNGRGYSVFFRQDLTGAVTIDYTGTHPATGANVSLPVAATANGYSLVGNPYPAPLLWSPTGWNKSTSISDIIAIRDNASGIFRYFDINDGDGVIATGQAFWVQTLNTLTTPTLEVNEQAKTSTQVSGGAFYRTSESIEDKLIISLTKSTNNLTNGLKDEAILRVLPGSLATLDGRDATKGDNAIATQNASGSNVTVQVHDLSIKSSDLTLMAINSVPSIACNQSYELNINNFLNPAYASLSIAAEAQVQYTFNFDIKGSLKALTWTLHDNYTNQDVNVSASPEHTFTVDNAIAASKASNRFIINVTAPAINTNLDVSTTTTTACEGTEAVIKVNNSQPGITYATEINGVLQPYFEQGNGSKISLFIESDELAQGTNTIRVKANVGCTQEFLAGSVQVTKESLPMATAEAVSRCAPGVVTLTASGAPTGGTYAWYAGAGSTTVLSSTSEFTTPALSDTTIYYVAARNASGCEGERVSVTAFIGKNGTDLQISQQGIVCGPASVELTAASQLPGVTYKWYNSPSAAESIGAGAVFTTPLLDTNTAFYVASVDGNGCESNRLAYTAQVAMFNPTYSISQSSTICFNGSADLEISGSSEVSNYKWYSSPGSTTALAEGTLFSTPALQNTVDYYVEAISFDGCISHRKQVSVAVRTTDPSAGLSASPQGTVCMNDNGIITATGGDAVNYAWYGTPTDVIPVGEGPVLTTSALIESTGFFVAAVSADGCIGSRKEVTAAVTKLIMPEIEEVSSVVLGSKNHTSGIQWYLDGNVLLGETNSTVTATRSGIYGLLVNTQGCESYTDKVFLVTGIEASLDNQIAIYPNPAIEKINMENQGTGPVEILMMNTQGKHIHSFILNKAESKSIEVHEVPKGIYLVQLRDKRSSSVKKIVIK